MNFLTKSTAVVLKYAIIIVLAQTTIAFGATANEEEKKLQEIINLPDSHEDTLQILEKHSKLGKLLSEYIRVFDRLAIDGKMTLNDSFPADVIPNYLALRLVSELQLDFNSQASKAASANLFEAHKQYNLLDEAGLFYNLIEFTENNMSNSDLYSRSLRIKNLRYISQYNEKWSDIYFKKLKRAKGWIVYREAGYWKTQLDFQRCENAKRVNDCILELAKDAPKKNPEKLMEIEKLFCEVKLISEGKILEVSVCE